ncbi:MAG: methyltransferase domain-containing protein [Myxococcota bacterium]
MIRFVPNMSRRDSSLELMEDPNLPPGDLVEALRQIRTLNHAFGGVHQSVRAIAALTERADQFTLLDVGCGDGEIPRRTHQWAKSKGITCSGLGVDLTSESIELARALTSPDAPLTFSQADLFDLGDEDTFDIVHTSLMLHHLNDEEAERALRKMLRLAKSAVVVNDLHRAWLCWAGAAIGARALTSSYVVQADAPHSVLRAFKRRELEALAQASGAREWSITWTFPFRWIMVLHR